jgi:hypothetical protein
MWNFIKHCWNEYAENQKEMTRLGIFLIPHWHGLFYYISPETQDKHDQSEPVSKDH